MPLHDGQVFAGYRIVRGLGSGGMGEVYLAQHPRLPRRDALKILRADASAGADYRARFEREADLASTLWHPHIVGVHDRGDVDGQLWISMDFVDGQNAAELLTARYPSGMPLDAVISVVTAVGSALDYAHKQGLLHRDVKPANIMLSHVDDESEQRILLADFGIARNADDISGLTSTNMTVGTVAYSAPEQLMGEDIDGCADQYALAATAYHLLTGAQLFPHSKPVAVISRHLKTAPPALAETRPDLAALDPVLAIALAKAPGDRYARCGDFARALAGGAARINGPSPTAPTKPAPAPQRPNRPSAALTASDKPPTERRVYWLVAVAASIVIALAVASLVVWRPWREAETSSSTQASPTRSVASPPLPSAPVPTSSTAPIAFPAVPPTNSGCRGDVITYQDIEHKYLGPVRIFLTQYVINPSLKIGCIATVAASGKVLPPIEQLDFANFGFATPATDTTGNTFVTYRTVRHGGVLVLVPVADGFADIGWDATNSSNGNYSGRLAIHFAELIGPDPSGEYTIRRFANDCTPNCADGTTSSRDLYWNGFDYVANIPVSESYTPLPSQAAPPTQPSVNLESACSNMEWRNANGEEGDRLCGGTRPSG